MKVYEFAKLQIRCVYKKFTKIVISNVHPNRNALLDNESEGIFRDIYFSKSTRLQCFVNYPFTPVVLFYLRGMFLRGSDSNDQIRCSLVIQT